MSEWTNQWKSIIFIKWENQLAKKKQKKISKTVEWHWQFIVIMILKLEYNTIKIYNQTLLTLIRYRLIPKIALQRAGILK